MGGKTLSVAIPFRLLGDDEPSPLETFRERSASPFFLTCDHAGNRIPKKLKSLGLQDCDLQRHIAWDIGAAAVARLLSESLDAFAILQTYSRLVIDCNRPPHAESSIATLSEYTVIPGNHALPQAHRDMRVNEVFQPYHERIRLELDRRQKTKTPTALVSVHSFTPVCHEIPRPWHVGALYNRDACVAKIVMELLRRESGLIVGDNEPYSVDDESDYTIPVHGEQRGLPHVGIEIRQDLIADGPGQRIWAERLARVLVSSWQAISENTCFPAYGHGQKQE
jgi:predicted N-formylglutamate amidohydrolase